MSKNLISLFGILFGLHALGEGATLEGSRRSDGAWLGADGVRAAWLSYKQIDDDMVRHLVDARVNTVFLKHGFHDLLDIEGITRVNGEIVVKVREPIKQRILASTERAAAGGLHVFWLANYELDQMLSCLRRLNYQAAHAEGPGRYLRKGAHDDAAPLDAVFWQGITGAHGELVARLSLEHPIAGLLYDTEHYGGGIMYLQNSGFSDRTFNDYLRSREMFAADDLVPIGQRYAFLKNRGQLADYRGYLEEAAFDQGRALAQRWHAINPRLILGLWPLLDNWFSIGMLRGMGGAVPVLGLSGVEYYHGADQSESMANYFQERCRNLIYMAGFYPPYAYTVDQLEAHVEQALTRVGHYWMLGPHEAISQSPYRQALRRAFDQSRVSEEDLDHGEARLSYRIAEENGRPILVVEVNSIGLETPTLSLWDDVGGAALCRDLRLTPAGEHLWRGVLPLERRITNNRFHSAGFRSGVSDKLNPLPMATSYEDPTHTKLFDGRAYGYFGTTVAWPATVGEATVVLDFHRDYALTRIELAQPRKLEDRHGGPSELTWQVRPQEGDWSVETALTAHFDVSQQGTSGGTQVVPNRLDPRHNRAWLSWRSDLPLLPARWVRLSLRESHPNVSLSVGELVVWAVYDGSGMATLKDGLRAIKIADGARWSIPSGAKSDQ